jgi:hypothetical protein
MKRLAVLALVLSFALTACASRTSEQVPDDAGREVSLLFVGNSHTTSGAVPTRLQEICARYDIEISLTVIAPNGASLADNKEAAIARLQEGGFDYAVFQEGGYWGPDDLFEDFLELTALLFGAARESGAIPVLYLPALLADGRPFQQAMSWAHEQAARDNEAILVNAGEAWIYALDNHPEFVLEAAGGDEIALYKSDGEHASDAGAYLTANVFAATLFDLEVQSYCTDSKFHGDAALVLSAAAREFVQYYTQNGRVPGEYPDELTAPFHGEWMLSSDDEMIFIGCFMDGSGRKFVLLSVISEGMYWLNIPVEFRFDDGVLVIPMLREEGLDLSYFTHFPGTPTFGQLYLMSDFNLFEEENLS